MCKKNDAFVFSMGIIAGVIGGIIGGVLFAPKSGEESRKFYEKHAPQIIDAKKQALESVDLMKYKLERQFKKINNAIKSKKMLKAKELEDIENSSDNEFDY